MNSMDMIELNQFFEYCDGVSDSRLNALVSREDQLWTYHRQALYSNGILPGMYLERDEKLLSLLEKQCNHKELVDLLKMEVKEIEESKFYQRAKQKGYRVELIADVEEPLLNWIANFNYLLAYPMCKTEKEILNCATPEKVLTYVYICLKYKYRKITSRIKQFIYGQPNTDLLYRSVFDKSSDFCSWGLLPIDAERKLLVKDNPVRIYDSRLDKTIYICLPRPVALVFNELYDIGKIKKLAVRSCDSEIYDGETHRSVLQEEVETGSPFSWNVNELPKVTKLYSIDSYEDSLWVKVKKDNLEFEEMCKDFYCDGDYIITQMIHMEHNDTYITHIDHEYIFYDCACYEERMKNPAIRGEARKRIKTFKIDCSSIEMEYLCKMYCEGREIMVPFIYFILNNYFEHKDLLMEYFHKIT